MILLRATGFCLGFILFSSDLAPRLGNVAASMSEDKTPRRRVRNLHLPELPPLDDVLRVHALHVLEVCQGNRRYAANVLGIDRKTLYRMLRRWGVPSP